MGDFVGRFDAVCFTLMTLFFGIALIIYLYMKTITCDNSKPLTSDDLLTVLILNSIAFGMLVIYSICVWAGKCGSYKDSNDKYYKIWVIVLLTIAFLAGIMSQTAIGILYLPPQDKKDSLKPYNTIYVIGVTIVVFLLLIYSGSSYGKVFENIETGGNGFGKIKY